MQSHWDKNELLFETSQMSGILYANCSGDDTLCNHWIKQFTHKKTKTLMSTDGQSNVMNRFGLSLFRILAHGSYLTELRSTRMEMIQHYNGATLLWHPTERHNAKVEALFTVKEPNIVDIDIRIEGYNHYQDYELLVADYVAGGFTNGVYVKKNDFRDHTPEQIFLKDNPVFHGMFNFFPRDEHAACILTDGRGQRGRWYWRTAIGRLYALPLVFSSNGMTDIILMGRSEDVAAIGATYAGDEQNDGVADHRALYLSLFGRDLFPGEGWQTQVRLVVDDALGAGKHKAYYESFLDYVSQFPQTFEITPY